MKGIKGIGNKEYSVFNTKTLNMSKKNATHYDKFLRNIFALGQSRNQWSSPDI